MNVAVKVGDLIKWEESEHGIILARTGVVLQLSRTGQHTFSAKVMSESGSVKWIATVVGNMEVISEG